MDGKERILRALEHKCTDKIPVDFGGTSTTGIHVMAYAKLLKYLGFNNLDVKLYDPMMQLAMVDKELIEKFNIDTVKLYRPTPKFGIPLFKGWKDGKMPDGNKMKVPVGFSPVEDSNGFNLIINGIIVAKRGKKSLYYDVVDNPLKDKSDISDLRTIKFPDYSEDEANFIKSSAADLRNSTKNAIIFSIKGSFLETPCDLRGYDGFLIDLAINKKYAEYLLDLLLEDYMVKFNSVLKLTGNNIDIIKITDDYGSQNGLFISPETYRSIIKPRQKKLFEYIKEKSGYKILLHSCGSVSPIIPDFIEIGLDAVNPVQTNARDMDPIELKNKFGKDMTFWGGTIEPINMANFSLDKIEYYIKKRIEIFSKGGGFVYSYIHNFQPDVSPEKIARFFEIVNESN